MIQFETEICDYLSIPSIPKKKWDGKTSFKDGVAVIDNGNGLSSYAVCTFNSDKEPAPRVVKVFSQEPFSSVGDIYVVPSFMNTDVEHMGMDDESKKAAERLISEANELSATSDKEKDEIDEMKSLPEWIFPEVSNKEEAQAWLRNYNTTNKLKGRIPENEETLKLRLLNIYSKMAKKNKR